MVSDRRIATVLMDGLGPAGLAEVAGRMLSPVMGRSSPEGLSRSITMLTAAIDAVPKDHLDLARMLSHLSAALVLRSMPTDRSADLDEAVAAGRRALALAPHGHRDHSTCLSTLSVALRVRAERTGNAADIDEAIEIGRQAAAATPEGHRDWGISLSSLGVALRVRFAHTGNMDNIHEAITLGRRAIAAVSDDHDDRIGCLCSLSNALRVRFERTGDISDVDEAITFGRQAVAATPSHHPERTAVLSDFGGALLVRFMRTNSSTDLDEAIATVRQAVDASTLRTDVNRAVPLSILSVALRVRFERTLKEADLSASLRFSRRAVAAAPHGHPAWGTLQNNLGNALSLRFERTGERTALDKATKAYRRAVAAVPNDHPDCGMYLSNLSNMLARRFERTGERAVIDEAAALGWQAVDATPDDHPNRGTYLANLGNTLTLRFELTGDGADLDAAVRVLEQAAQSPTTAVTHRLTAASNWARNVARCRTPAAAAEAYTAAIGLLPLLLWRGITHHDQQQLLGKYATSLAREGAASAIAADQPGLAVELLEAGRGIYWSQLLSTRTDLTALYQTAPNLAAQLAQCRAVLEHAIPGLPTSAPRDPAAEAQTRMDAARRFEHVVQQVRALAPSETFPHPDRFLKPPAIRNLLPRPGDHPIVIVNVSLWRCDALIVTADGVDAVELAEVTEDQVVVQANRYLKAVHSFEADQISTDPRSQETAVNAVLEWLWDHITGPILDHLGHTSIPTNGDWPRVRWCPTGALTLLPLHAAGHHDTSDAVLDRAVSSYTPTLTALTHAQARTSAPQPAKILVIALPDTPEQSRLSGAGYERDLLAAAFTAGARTILDGPAATRDAVLEQLSQHRWLHASCHGSQDLSDPATGGLLPYDWNTAGLVTVTDLTNPGHTGGEFAFLSACKTATGGTANLDEAITVASAMQHAGWRHVIGTLWSVLDRPATTVTHAVYEQVRNDDAIHADRAAHALHHAVRALRRAAPKAPSYWAPFIHLGP